VHELGERLCGGFCKNWVGDGLGIATLWRIVQELEGRRIGDSDFVEDGGRRIGESDFVEDCARTGRATLWRIGRERVEIYVVKIKMH